MRQPFAKALGIVLLAALAAPPAAALINPNFTPVHLVSQSDLILVLRIGPLGAKGEIPVQIAECLKGKAPEKPPTLDLSKTAGPQAEAFQRLVGKAAPQLALLFCGKFSEETPEAGGGEEAARGAVGLLHTQGAWFRLVGTEPGTWLLDVLDEHLQSSWAGGTDMLARATKYVLADPAASVPARTGASWADVKEVARLDGKVHGAMAVDLAGDGRLALHILCETGDRLLQWDKEKRAIVDIAVGAGPRARPLGARSHAAAWGDLNGDGRLDLASWDGRALSLWLQTEGGAFEAKGSGAELQFSDCVGFTTLALGDKGRVGLVVSLPSYPLLLAPGEGGALKTGYLVPPVAGKFIGSGLGAPRPCLIADFDGDAVPDVLQPFAKGAVFYKGKGLGVVDGGTRIEGIGTGEGEAGAFIGDFDADGLLDVFVAADERCFIWHNRGEAKFEETLGYAGEIAYISKPCGIGGMTGDVNNDGRQDVLILYSNRSPHIFFNRGFRSFGHSHMLDIDENRLLEAAGGGQQAGLLADLDGDGGQDMALVLANGEVWVLFRDTQDMPALCLRAALPVGGFAGPLTVTGWSEKRCLGAWNVVAGTSEAFFGQYEPGPIKLRWQFPGGKPQEKEIIVEEKPVRFLLKP